MDTRIQRLGAIALGAVLALALVVPLAGCGADSRELSAAEESVQQLLTLRAERSVDASAYAEFVLEASLAQELANASQIELQAESTITPTPDWEQPYVSAQEDSEAAVVVVWVLDDAHPDWPIATVFDMRRVDDSWLAADANAIEGTGTVPPPLN